MKKIIAAVDLSDITPKVIETASRLASLSGAKLYLIHAEIPEISPNLELNSISPSVAGGLIFPQGVPPVVPANREEEKRYFPELESIRKKLEREGLNVENVLLYNGDIGGLILKKASDIDADLIVIGARKHSFLHKLFFEELGINFISKCPCPVVVVPENCQKRAIV
ncbi:MAG: hypothetical protein A2020_09120 [Lentisphaerae bacterium GWF2_45_14]|nr:MAG: hypothetical protein A2020_09120 [Lentisphaerae bacterium GWF2_45_14]